MSELNRSPCRLNESAKSRADNRLMETATVTFERMDEADKSKGLGRIKGIAGQADFLNRNGRYYPLDIVTAAIEAAQAMIQEGRFLCLAEHPDFDEPDTGELDDVAARITSLYLDGTTIHYEAIVINNEAGQNAAALMQAGVKVGASTRATGSGNLVKAGDVGIEGVDPGTEVYKINALVLLGVDLTLNPSVSNTTAALTESQTLPPPTPKEKIMNLDQLKKDHPALYESIIKEGKLMAESQQQSASVEAELARLKAENDSLKTAALNSVRTSIVTRALTEAALPKLGNAGDINLDERFERQVESAALSAASDVDAKKAVDLLITERRAILGQNTSVKANEGVNRAGLPAGNTEKTLTESQDKADRDALNGVNSARSALGL